MDRNFIAPPGTDGSGNPPIRAFLVQGWPWLLAISVCGMVVSCFPLQVDPDPFWHLKTGEYLLQHRTGLLPDFPATDVFSVSGADRHWANHEWLADMLMYAVYDSPLGLRGLIFIKSLIFIAAFLCVYVYAWRRTGDTVIPGLIAILAVFSSQWTADLRPPILTYLFVGLYLNLLYSLEKRPERHLPIITVLVLLMVPWVNLHGGAILGILLPVLWAAGLLANAIEARILERPDPTKFNWANAFGRAIVLIFLASLANPFGLDIHRLTFTVMQSELVTRTNAELQPPSFLHTTSFDALLIIAVLALAGFATRTRWRVRYSDLFIVGFFMLQSVLHVRHIPLFALCAVGPVSDWIRGATSKAPPLPSRADYVEGRAPLVGAQPAVSRPHTVVVAVLAAVIVLVYYHTGFHQGRFYRHVNFWRIPQGFVSTAFPAEACDFVRYVESQRDLANPGQNLKFPGNMFNTVNYSGYLIWALSPELHKVFTDSRFDIHGEEYLVYVMAVEQAVPLHYKYWEYFRKRSPLSDADAAAIPELTDSIEKGYRKPYWQTLLLEKGIGFMIIERDASKPVVALLERGNAGWTLVYQDPGFDIFVRDDPAFQPFIAEARRLADRWSSARLP